MAVHHGTRAGMTKVIGFDSEAAFQRARQAIHKSERDVGTNRIPRGRWPINPTQFPCMIGKASGAITQGQSGTVAIWHGSEVEDAGDLSDTGKTVSALALFGDVASGA